MKLSGNTILTKAMLNNSRHHVVAKNHCVMLFFGSVFWLCLLRFTFDDM
jgi:hypothetical protein